jgi:hypothetical protein
MGVLQYIRDPAEPRNKLVRCEDFVALLVQERGSDVISFMSAAVLRAVSRSLGVNEEDTAASWSYWSGIEVVWTC